MVRIIVRKQALAAKCQHSFDFAKPSIHPGKTLLVAPAVEGIRLTQAARDDF
jgi:hypothetical protein